MPIVDGGIRWAPSKWAPRNARSGMRLAERSSFVFWYSGIVVDGINVLRIEDNVEVLESWKK